MKEWDEEESEEEGEEGGEEILLVGAKAYTLLFSDLPKNEKKSSLYLII